MPLARSFLYHIEYLHWKTVSLLQHLEKEECACWLCKRTERWSSIRHANNATQLFVKLFVCLTVTDCESEIERQRETDRQTDSRVAQCDVGEQRESWNCGTA